MGLMILFQAHESFVLWVLLGIAVWLTFIEARELELDRRLTTWWVLLVLITHVFGYLAMRVWAFFRRRSAQAA